MDDIFVAQVMSSELVTVSPDTLVEDAARTLQSRGIGSLLVLDGDDELVGILTTTDFVDIVAESKPKAQTTVGRYMTEDLITVDAGTPLSAAADTMVEHGLHHLPVVEAEDGLVGIVTTTDVADYLSRADARTHA